MAFQTQIVYTVPQHTEVTIPEKTITKCIVLNVATSKLIVQLIEKRLELVRNF